MAASTRGKPVRPSHHASKRWPARLQEIRPRRRSGTPSGRSGGSGAARGGGSRASRAGAGTPRAPSSAREPLLDLARRQAAEVEVGREPRGGVGAEGVAIVRVRSNAVVQESVEPLAVRATRRLGGRRSSARRPAVRESPRASVRKARRKAGAPITSRRAPRARDGRRARTPCTGGPPGCGGPRGRPPPPRPGCTTGATLGRRATRRPRRANGPTSSVAWTALAPARALAREVRAPGGRHGTRYRPAARRAPQGIRA